MRAANGVPIPAHSLLRKSPVRSSSDEGRHLDSSQLPLAQTGLLSLSSRPSPPYSPQYPGRRKPAGPKIVSRARIAQRRIGAHATARGARGTDRHCRVNLRAAGQFSCGASVLADATRPRRSRSKCRRPSEPDGRHAGRPGIARRSLLRCDRPARQPFLSACTTRRGGERFHCRTSAAVAMHPRWQSLVRAHVVVGQAPRDVHAAHVVRSWNRAASRRARGGRRGAQKPCIAAIASRLAWRIQVACQADHRRDTICPTCRRQALSMSRLARRSRTGERAYA